MSDVSVKYKDSTIRKRHSHKERHREKPKKSRADKKHERRKEKKNHKKKERKQSSESDTESDTDSDRDSKNERVIEKQRKADLEHQKIMECALFGIARNRESRKLPEKNSCITDRPGQNVRELNPYWKDGGCGLPEEKTARTEKFDKCETTRLNFKMPSDANFATVSGDGERRRNWKKKSADAGGDETKASDSTYSKREGSAQKILSDSELNALAAKVVKAEILGNKVLSEKLKSELKEAKERKAEAEKEGSRPLETPECVLLTKTNRQGFTVPAKISSRESIGGSGSKRKRKIETHDGGQRQRYFPDDDKYSLKDMFVKEKATTAEDEERDRIKMLSKCGKRYKDEEEEEVYLDAARYKESEEKQSRKEMDGYLNEAKSKQKSLEGCKWCLDNKNKSKHLIVEIGKKCYLCLPEETSLTDGHCLIVPIHHTPCSTVTDEDVWEEMKHFKKKLCDLFAKQGQDPVFFENARGLHKYPHMVLHCVPLDKEDGDMAPIYFKKALLESETEWSNNKKVVDLKTKDVRRSIPKGLPYFAVDFGREGGFAHVIEDEKLFPSNFAEEIIGGMLDLDHRIWRKHQKQSFDFQRDKFLKFIKMYRDFGSEQKTSESSDSSGSESDDSSHMLRH